MRDGGINGFLSAVEHVGSHLHPMLERAKVVGQREKINEKEG